MNFQAPFAKSALALGLSMVVGCSAQANTGFDEFNDDFPEDELLFSDIDSVFSASKYEQKITQAPARINIVTADEIRRQGYRSLVDIINTIPGFQTTYDRIYSYIGSRGLAIPGDYNTRMLLLVDGHRVNENIYNGMLIDNGLIVDIDLIERLEVVRGSASSLYGSNAFFGVINIITKRGRDIQGGVATVSGGSQDTSKASLTIGDKLGNGIEYLVSATHFNSDGNDNLYYAEFDTSSSNDGHAVNVDKTENNSVFANLSYRNVKFFAGFQNKKKHDPTGSYDVVFNSQETKEEDQRSFADLKYEQSLEDGTQLMARVSYDGYEYNGQWAYDYSEDGDLSDIEIWKEQIKGQWWGAEFSVNKHLFEHHNITMGGEYRGSFEEKQRSFDSYDTPLDLDTNSETWGVYAQDNINLTDTLVLNAGLRFDSFSEYENSTNPRLAFIWSPWQSTSYKLIYGSAFRAPNTYEALYHDGDDSHKQSKNLKPETIDSYEFIIEHQVNNNLKLITSLFKNDIKDLIALTTDQSDGLVVFQNKNNVTAKGGDIELQGRWQDGWEGSVSYSYQESENESSSQSLSNFPSNQIKMNVETPVLAYGISAGLSFQYESDRKTLKRNETGDYILTNLHIIHDSFIPELSLSITVNNLFDQRYYHAGAVEHLQDKLIQDGRTFLFKSQYSF